MFIVWDGMFLFNNYVKVHRLLKYKITGNRSIVLNYFDEIYTGITKKYRCDIRFSQKARLACSTSIYISRFKTVI